MTEPKFMQLCRDNPGEWFDCVHVGGYPNRACFLKGTNDVWLVENHMGAAHVRTYTDVVDHFTDPKPKPKRRFARMDPKTGELTGYEYRLTFEQVLERARNCNYYPEVVEVIVYAVNEDGTRDELLYGVPEVE